MDRVVIGGSAVGTLPVPFRAGCGFRGWWTAPKGVSGKRVTADTIVAGNVTDYAHWHVDGTAETPVELDGLTADVTSDGEGGWIVTLTNDVASADLPIEIPDNIGPVTVDLGGHDLTGGDGEPVIRIVPGEGEGEPTQITVVTGGGDATLQGGEGAPAIVVDDGAQDGVVVNVGEDVTVKGGGDDIPAIIGDLGENEGTIVKPTRLHIPGEGKVTVPKTWKTGQKVTWKATAAKGSVFAHWEGQVVDGLGLSRNELRNPSLQFAVPADFDTNEVRAVFLAVDDDRLSELTLSQTGPFAPNVEVKGLELLDDSESYVTATVSGLPTGLRFNTKTLAITGKPTKSGVFWVQLKAKSASGYQWAENVKVTVSGGGTEAREPKLTRTAYHPLTVASADEAGGTATGTGVYAEGKKVSVSAKPAKGYAFAGWFRDAELSEPMEFSAGDSRKASQSVVVPEVRYLFAKFVTLEEDKRSISLSVDGMEMPDATELAPSWSNYCGVAVSWPLAADALSEPTVKAAGLPSGVKLVQDKKTGLWSLAGVPTAASKADAKTKELVPSKVKLTVTTAGKSSKVYAFDWTILPLPTWAVGTFDGLVSDDADVTSASLPSGTVTMTIASNGKISGKMLKGDKTWTMSASAFNAVLDARDARPYQAGGDGMPCFLATLIAKSGKVAVTNEVDVMLDESVDFVRGKASGDEMAAWQNLWKTDSWKMVATSFAKAQPVTLETEFGLVSMKFAASGAVTAKLGTYSCTSTLIPVGDNEYAVYLHFPPKTGKFSGFDAVVALIWDGTGFSLGD